MMSAEMRKITLAVLCLAVIAIVRIVPSWSRQHQQRESAKGSSHRAWPGWKTNVEKRLIDLDELQSGGPGKGGIPAIDKPIFVKPKEAEKWLQPPEPVISLLIDGQAKAYPLQILIWHEIVNDALADVPVAVTFCPLCYSAIAFDRRIDDKEYTFGVSGKLRHEI